MLVGGGKRALTKKKSYFYTNNVFSRGLNPTEVAG